MIGRRGLLGLILGAPVAGRAVVEEAVAAAVAPNVPSPYGQLGKKDPETARLNRRWWRKADTFHHLYGRDFPVSVASKKSWSPVFKLHVTEQMRREHDDRFLAAQEIVEGPGSGIEKMIRLAAMGIKL